jgi:NarL family two-component system response regulator LiaR
MGGKIKVVIADDHALFREMLRLAMRGEGSIKIVGEAANWRQTIDVISGLKPDIVLLDSTMSEMDGIEALPAIREKSPKTKALMMKANKNEAAIFSALKGGAKGYLSKDVSISDLIKAIKAVHIGELWVERRLMARFFDREAIADSKGEGRAGRPKKVLTPREKEVLCILTTGCTNKEIAQALFISEKTVKSHLNSIFKKLNVTRRLQAILEAIKQGLS